MHYIDDIDNKCKKYESLSEYIYSYGGILVIVGGYIRNIIYNIEHNDCDAEVYFILKDKIIEILSKRYRTLLVGVSFAVIKLVDENIDISLPRTDICIGSGHKSFDIYVDEFMSYYRSARRRDLTINSIGYCIKYKILFDYYKGIDDIHNKNITPVDTYKFMEDPLRLLRAVYFATKLQFKFSDAMLQLYIKYNHTIMNMSIERVSNEIYKIFNSKHMSYAFQYLHMIENEMFNFAKYIYKLRNKEYIYMKLDNMSCIISRIIFIKLIYQHSDINVLISKFPSFKLKTLCLIDDIVKIILSFYDCNYKYIFLIMRKAHKLNYSENIIKYLHNVSVYIHIDEKIYTLCKSAIHYCNTVRMKYILCIINDIIDYTIFNRLCNALLCIYLHDTTVQIQKIHIIVAYYFVLFYM